MYICVYIYTVCMRLYIYICTYTHSMHMLDLLIAHVIDARAPYQASNILELEGEAGGKVAMADRSNLGLSNAYHI